MTRSILSLILLLWHPSQPAGSDGIDAYEISRIVPKAPANGKMVSYDTSTVQVFYYEDLVLYKLTYLYSHSENDIEVIKDQPRTHYILYKPGEPHGFDLDEHKQRFKRAVQLDSVFRGEWSKQPDLYPLFGKMLPKPNVSQRQGDSLVERYTIRDEKGSVILANIELKFTTSIGNIELSISKGFDSLKNMKLYELSFVGAKDYFKAKGLTEGTYYSLYRLKKLDHFDTRFIKALFSLYEPGTNGL